MNLAMPRRVLRIGKFFQLALFYLKLVTRRFTQDGCQHSAAALTYMTLFALVPLLTVMFTVLSLVPSFASLSAQVEELILANMLPSAGAGLFSYLRDFSSQARLLSAPGIILLVVTAYLMLVNIEKVFNRIWGAPGRRSGVSSFLVYWAVLSLGPLLLGAGLMINTYLLSLRIITDNAEISGRILALLEYLPWLMTALAFSLLYKAVPNTRVLFKNAAIGGLVAMLVFEAAKAMFGLIVSNTGFRSIYGAFSIVPLFLLWIYFSWIIILAGAEFVRATETFFAEVDGVRYGRSQALLMALAMFHKAQLKGLAMSDRRMLASGLPSAQWHELRNQLLARKVITLTQQGRYVLIRDLSQMSVWQMLELMGDDLVENVAPIPERVNAHHPWMGRYNGLVDAVRDEARESLELSLAELFQSGNTDETSNRG